MAAQAVQLFLQFGYPLCKLGVVVAIVQFVGVLPQVEEFPVVALAVVFDEFVVVGADAAMGADAVRREIAIGLGHSFVAAAVQPPRVFVVGVVGRATPVGGRLALEQGREARALDSGGRGDSGQIEDGGGVVDVDDGLFRDVAGLAATGITREQGDAQAWFVHEALVIPAVFADEVTVVGGVDDEGVVSEAFVVEIVEYPAEVFVDAGDGAVAVASVALVDPLAAPRRV